MNLQHFASLTGIQLLVAEPIVYHRALNLTRWLCISLIVQVDTVVV